MKAQTTPAIALVTLIGLGGCNAIFRIEKATVGTDAGAVDEGVSDASALDARPIDASIDAAPPNDADAAPLPSWDLSRDFTSASSAGPPWAYSWANAQQISPCAERFDRDGLVGWAAEAEVGYRNWRVMHNASDVEARSDGVFYPPTTTFLDGRSGIAAVTWLAPTTGAYAVHVAFQLINGTQAYVVVEKAGVEAVHTDLRLDERTSLDASFCFRACEPLYVSSIASRDQREPTPVVVGATIRRLSDAEAARLSCQLDAPDAAPAVCPAACTVPIVDAGKDH